MNIEVYEKIRAGGAGFRENPRGLIAVWGREAVPFLDGMITNDMKTLEDGQQMLAAFPNAQGRLLAVVRVLRRGDRFLFETEEATREKVFQNLFRFTFAGDFFVEDLSNSFRFAEIWNFDPPKIVSEFRFESNGFQTLAIPDEEWANFSQTMTDRSVFEIPAEVYEVLRIESGVPLFGVDMDETTIVPELGMDELISYTKGCYIGQEIIARIHFRGHVAKKLAGLVFGGSEKRSAAEITERELLVPDGGKNAGRITSVVFSPMLDAPIAIGYVRYDHLAEGTNLLAGDEPVRVVGLPFKH